MEDFMKLGKRPIEELLNHKQNYQQTVMQQEHNMALFEKEETLKDNEA